MWSIYKYTNKVNNHLYIGFSNNPEKRYAEHKKSSFNPNDKDYNQAIHKAIRKYGLENFIFEILENNIPTLQQAKEREQFWIKKYKAYENRENYNETPGGDCPGFNAIHLGEEHGMAILTEEQVKYCRKCYAEGKRSRDIYNELIKNNEISYSGFLRMWHGKNWKHIMPQVFQNNPHRAKYGAKDRDILTKLFKGSGLSLNKFVKSKDCYVGYGTLWKMINNPEFYDNK